MNNYLWDDKSKNNTLTKAYFFSKIQSCMSFTENIVVAKISAKVMHSSNIMQFIYEL